MFLPPGLRGDGGVVMRPPFPSLQSGNNTYPIPGSLGRHEDDMDQARTQSCSEEDASPGFVSPSLQGKYLGTRHFKQYTPQRGGKEPRSNGIYKTVTHEEDLGL